MARKRQDEEYHRSHKRHRNALYGLVVVLVVLQTASFIVLTLQAAQLNVELAVVKKNLTESFSGEIAIYNEANQAQFDEIARALGEQQSLFSEEIKLLQAAQDDFSGVIQDAIKGVVSVGTERSAGTGFVIDNKGYVVTNFHVVQDANTIRVLTFERDILNAQLVGIDSFRDIALLKIEPNNYEALKLADSSEVQVGNKVIAIGNPLGLSFSVTEGIVSAVDREGPNGLNEYVQTDVSLNPGNSGGPLINTRGEVVGINNFKIGGGAEGLGFALESDSIRVAVRSFTNETVLG
jgi:S1-C subfamily serine protease